MEEKRKRKKKRRIQTHWHRPYILLPTRKISIPSEFPFLFLSLSLVFATSLKSTVFLCSVHSQNLFCSTMAVILFCYLIFLAFTSHSSATYCICKDGQSDQALQKSLDYACGAGADCSPILQNGPCFQPNTVKDHCSYAVNSYFQRKGQVQGSCDFSGTAMPSQSPPAETSGCVYPSSPSNTGTPTSTTPSTTVPSTTPGTTTNPSTTPPSTTTTPGTTSPSVFGGGISPTGGVGLGGSGNSMDGSAAAGLTAAASNLFFFTATVIFWLSLLC